VADQRNRPNYRTTSAARRHHYHDRDLYSAAAAAAAGSAAARLDFPAITPSATANDDDACVSSVMRQAARRERCFQYFNSLARPRENGGGGWNPPRPLASRAVRRICAKLKIYFWVLAEYIRTSASTELSSVCQNAPRSTDSNVKFYC